MNLTRTRWDNASRAMSVEVTQDTMPFDAVALPLHAEAIFDAFEQPVSVFRCDGTYAYINAAGLSLLGRAAGERSDVSINARATRPASRMAAPAADAVTRARIVFVRCTAYARTAAACASGTLSARTVSVSSLVTIVYDGYRSDGFGASPTDSHERCTKATAQLALAVQAAAGIPILWAADLPIVACACANPATVVARPNATALDLSRALATFLVSDARFAGLTLDTLAAVLVETARERLAAEAEAAA